MRKADSKKIAGFEKAAKTINFDKIVLQRLETMAKKERTSVSNIVNMLCRHNVMTDVEYYRQLSKMHYLKFQEYQFMKNQAEEMIICKTEG